MPNQSLVLNALGVAALALIGVKVAVDFRRATPPTTRIPPNMATVIRFDERTYNVMTLG